MSFFAKVEAKRASLSNYNAAVDLIAADVNSHPGGSVCKEGYSQGRQRFHVQCPTGKSAESASRMMKQQAGSRSDPPKFTCRKLIQIAWHLMTPGVEFDHGLGDE